MGEKGEKPVCWCFFSGEIGFFNRALKDCAAEICTPQAELAAGFFHIRGFFVIERRVGA